VSSLAATSVLKGPLASVLHTVVDVVAHSLVATRVPGISSFALHMAAASVAGLSNVTNRLSADPAFVLHTEEDVGVLSMAARSRPSRRLNIASSMVEARSACKKSVKRLLVVELSTALLMEEEYAVNWKGVIV
jgi:hypothetical protein